MSRFARLLPYLRHHRRGIAGLMALSLLAAGLTALEPWPLKLLADTALGEGEPPPWLAEALASLGLSSTPLALMVVAAGGTVVLFAGLAVLEAVLSWLWTRVGQAMMYDVAADMFASLQRQTPGYHRKRQVGDALSRLTGDVWCVFGFVQGVLVAPLQHAATAVFIAVLAWRLDPVLTLVLLGVAPLLAASARVFGPMLKRRAKAGQEAKSRLASFIQQTLVAMPVVQTFHTGDRNRGRFDRLADDATAATQAGMLARGAYRTLNGLLTTVGLAAVLLIGGLRTIDGAITVGSLLVFLAYVRSLQTSSLWLMATWSALKTAEASLDRVVEVLDADECVTEAEDATPLDAEKGVGHLLSGVGVGFDRVTFGYAPDRPVLREVSFEAEPGRVLAIVGPTGSGKSTLASLVPRLFDPDAGRVLLGGRDARGLTLDSLRAAVAVVPQEPLLLPASIADNIAFGRPDAARHEVAGAADDAGLSAWLDALPDGLDTMLGERGATVSGGQRQRIAIARALLTGAPVVVLDEPTAALDAETEAKVMAAMAGALGGRTLIVIAHRLSTVRAADHVVVLEAGRVVEQGPPDDLLARRGGAFRGLWDRQHGGDGAADMATTPAAVGAAP